VPKIRIWGYLRVFFLPNFSATDTRTLPRKKKDFLKNGDEILRIKSAYKRK
jgi:hypothetical protein